MVTNVPWGATVNPEAVPPIMIPDTLFTTTFAVIQELSDALLSSLAIGEFTAELDETAGLAAIFTMPMPLGNNVMPLLFPLWVR